MAKSDSTSKNVASSAAKILKSKTASKAVRSVAASALTQLAPKPKSEVETLRARVAELEAIVHSKTAMLNELAMLAGFQVGDTFNVAALVSKLRERNDH